MLPTKPPTDPLPLPGSFIRKKAAILATISIHSDPSYKDKSPKGTIDAEIIDLIDEINTFDGYVTTSSCAGRVAVFVEGRKGEGETTTGAIDDDHNDDNSEAEQRATVTQTTKAGPGGKGHGNKWLYVSHEPIPTLPPDTTYHDLFNLTPISSSSSSTLAPPYPHNPRLIKLTFSPLILHILCSALQTAKPLLSASINAGFRESGVQSLKALDDEEAGVMLAVRTAGCVFETVVGYVDESVDGQEVYRSVVGEEWLGVCVGVVNGRFGSNRERKERLRGEIRGLKMGGQSEDGEWEDKEVRRARKRKEGLKVKREKEREDSEVFGTVRNDNEDDGLGDGLFLEENT